MSNYQGRTKGTRRIVIWHDGKRHERIVEGSKKEGDEYEAKWRLDFLGLDAVDPKLVPAFSDFCVTRYRPHAEKHLKASTWKQVRIYQIDTLCKHLGHFKIDQVDSAENIERYKDVRIKEKVFRHGKWHPIKPSSINNELRVLRTVLNWAKELGYKLPSRKVKKLPVRGDGRAKAWTAEEIQAFFRATLVRYPAMFSMLAFMVNTGCRKGEAIAAEWSWIDFNAEMIRIPSNEVWQPKNGKPREVPLSDSLRAVLTSAKRFGKYCFPNKVGERYACFPKDIFNEIRTEAGVTGGPHTTRHTFASHFLQVQPDMRLLSEVLGHSHQRVTELYSHMMPNHLARARNAVNIGLRLETVAVTVAPEKAPEAK